MTVITGAPSPSRSIASASVASVATTVRWRGYVPHCTAAAGVSGDIPPATSASAMRGSVFTPMYSTIVPPARASADQSVCVSSFAGSSWPGDEGDRRRDAAMRDGNARVRRRGDARRHARHDLERHARLGERLRLLAAAAEDERIAALEPHDALPLAPELDEQRVDRRPAAPTRRCRRACRRRAARPVARSYARASGDERGIGERVVRRSRRRSTSSSPPRSVSSPGSPGPAPTR